MSDEHNAWEALQRRIAQAALPDFLLKEDTIGFYASEQTYKGKTFAKRYAIVVDGKVIGHVERRLATRERKTPGKRYVNARWYSPGWFQVNKSGRDLERYSRKDAVEAVLRDFIRDKLTEEQEQKNAQV